MLRHDHFVAESKFLFSSLFICHFYCISWHWCVCVCQLVYQRVFLFHFFLFFLTFSIFILLITNITHVLFFSIWLSLQLSPYFYCIVYYFLMFVFIFIFFFLCSHSHFDLFLNSIQLNLLTLSISFALCIRFQGKVSHESIKQLVLEAEHLVRDEALKTPTKQKHSSSSNNNNNTNSAGGGNIVQISTTIKKREVLMPGPIKRVQVSKSFCKTKNNRSIINKSENCYNVFPIFSL